MRSFRSILGLALAVLAFGWVRPASAQMTVTGLVAQSSALVRQKLPIYITPRSTVQYVAPWMITSDTVTTRTDTNGAYSFAVLRGNYTVKFGPMTNDWVTIAVESNSGTNNLSDLVTSTNLLFSLTNLMVGATTGADGLSGLVPQPLAGDEVKWLRGDGTWASGGGGGGSGMVTNETLVVAGAGATVTPSTDGTTNIFTVSVSASGAGNTFDQDGSTTFTFDAQ
jgi:hypothetical protein